ncbi:Threonine/homoserine/homoserine lactone efflux protein [Halorubrum aquaticum]|uniref:Threonine/homoserine/homoserine lactone efflux protein n=1 Tax=Halorubrum aquaticum TaxID=387340 RepID=A0A1I3ADW9_9EURY|nr:LysE family translocator [Halorubrum aquaticum]SFH48292.1 Threonine/homoserine/homoserine lactone efflux protein [Halorubrum aquaticum]
MVAAGFPLAPPTYALFVLAAATLIVTPGPDTLFVLSCGLENRAAGLRAALGVTAGILFHTALVVVGVAAVYRAVPGAERVVRVAGGIYLCYLGVDTLRSAGDDAPPTGGDGIREGFLVNALNPQVALFFLAFLPGFVGGGDVGGGAGGGGVGGGALGGFSAESGAIALLGATYAGLTAVYLGCVAIAADGAAGVLQSAETGRRLDRVAGGILLLLGVWVLVG